MSPTCHKPAAILLPKCKQRGSDLQTTETRRTQSHFLVFRLLCVPRASAVQFMAIGACVRAGESGCGYKLRERMIKPESRTEIKSFSKPENSYPPEKMVCPNAYSQLCGKQRKQKGEASLRSLFASHLSVLLLSFVACKLAVVVPF